MEDGEAARTLSLHPGLTVVVGIGAAARAALLDEMVHALAGRRPGTHIELVDHHGTHLAVLHPRQGASRMVDARDGTDLSAAVRDPRGRIDLLRALGLDVAEATALMRLGPEALTGTDPVDATVTALADLDQDQLWTCATAAADSAVEIAPIAPDADPADHAPDADGGPRHLDATEVARTRRGWRRRGRQDHQTPSATTGDPRRRWSELAGNVTVDWALAHREEIEATASLRRQLAALTMLSSTVPEGPAGGSGGFAGALVDALVRTRHVGAEGLPLVLEDPFGTVDGSLKPLLLELVGHASKDQQIVLLTDDDDVASWARLEALTGELGLVEPTGTGAAVLHR